MAKRRDLSSGWQSFEIIQRDGNGVHSITPFSDAFADSDRLEQIINKIRIVQNVGWPEAKRTLVDDRGHPLIVKKDEIIWLLKCKPTCWRLYFYVYEQRDPRRIIYVHAVCKKQDKEDPRDSIEARRIADTIRPGGSAITPFEFPPC